MKPKAAAKFAVDIFMVLSLLLVMGYQFWGEAPHEWIGTGMFFLFITHHILNGHWHKALSKGKYSTMRIFMLLINALALISMLAQIYSSVVMSRYVFDFLPFGGNMSLARRLHILGAYWGFLFMSLHLGLHWSMILGTLQKAVWIKRRSKILSTSAFITGLAISGYGAYAFVERNFFTYLFLKSEFVFLDYNEPKMLFYIDYLALMGLCIFIAHYGTKLIRKFKKKLEEA